MKALPFFALPFPPLSRVAQVTGLVLALSHAASAAPRTWTGATNGIWGTGTNWTPNSVPSLADDLTIFGPGNVAGALTVNLNSASSARSINFTDTAAVTLSNTTSGVNQSLSLGAGGITTGTGGVTIGSATANQNINVVLGASQTWSVGNALTVNNVISDGGNGYGITKAGAGTLNLNGANTFTGRTAITGGTISITNENALGVTPASFVADQLTLNGGTLNTTANLSANRGVVLGAGGGTINAVSNSTPTINGIISGTGALTVISSNASGRSLTLAGANTFTGGVTVGGVSTVSVGNATALGTGTLTIGTSESGNNSVAAINGVTFSNLVTVTPGGTRTIRGTGGTSTVAGAITLVGGVTNPTLTLGVATSGQPLNITGGITGTGNVGIGQGSINTRPDSQINISGAAINNVGTITSGGSVGAGSTFTISANIGSNVTGVIQTSTMATLVLSGASNTYSGNTTIAAGTLKAGVANAIPFGSGKGNVVLDGGATAAGIFDLNGFDVTINGLSGVAGAVLGQVVNGTGNKTLTVGSNGTTSSFAGVIASGAGTLAVTKVGAGVQALTGANTYTGGTTISAGTLQAGNASALGLGNVDIGGSGKLQGTVAAVNIGGALNLNTGGTLDIRDIGAGQLTLATGSSFFMDTGSTWNLNITSTTAFDRILGAGAGSFFYVPGGTLDLSGSTLAVGNYAIFSGFDTGNLGAFTAITGYDSSAYTVTFDDASTPGAGILQIAAVPEPGTWAMLLAGGGMLILIRQISRRSPLA